MRILLSVFLAALFFMGVPASAQDMRHMSILTGQTSGTYHRFGQDIARIIRKDCGAAIMVKESFGSLANLQRLRHEEYSQLAIVQQDTLEYLKAAAAQDAKLQDIISRIRYVFPLYSEEVHLVTTKGSGITGLRDLAGKAVAVGNLESGTYLTASFILLLSKVVVKPVEIDQTEALQRLLLPAGNPARVDALFYVAGTPVPLFADDPSLRRRLAAVPIVEPAVLQKYSPAQFTSRDYGWVADKVDTVRVRSVLMSFDFRRDQCANVGMVANRIKKHLPELQGGLGHPKWAEVDIAAPLPGWQAYDCVAQYIDAHVGPRGGRRCAFINAPASVGATPPSTASDDPFCVSGKENNNPIVQNLCSNLNKLPQ